MQSCYAISVSCSRCPCCAGTSQDTKGAVGKLEMIFALLIHSLACLAYLAIFNVSPHALTAIVAEAS